MTLWNYFRIYSAYSIKAIDLFVISTSGRTVRTDILLLAISAFTTSMWIMQEVEQCMEQRSGVPRNLESKSQLSNKISLAGRNDSSINTLKQPGMTYSKV